MKRHEAGFLNHEPEAIEQQEMGLEQCEVALFGALRRQLEASALVGAQLAKIRERELYRAAGCKTFELYCHRFLELTRDQVRRLIQLHEVVETIRAASLELPANEMQAVLCAKIPRAQLSECWRTLLAVCARKQVALSDRLVRRAVEIAREQQDSQLGECYTKGSEKVSRRGKGNFEFLRREESTPSKGLWRERERARSRFEIRACSPLKLDQNKFILGGVTIGKSGSKSP